MWNKPRGTLGEFRTDYVLNNEALKELSYIRTISNVYVENNGNYTEIDVIALTDKGIYVMESKTTKAGYTDAQMTPTGRNASKMEKSTNFTIL